MVRLVDLISSLWISRFSVDWHIKNERILLASVVVVVVVVALVVVVVVVVVAPGT